MSVYNEAGLAARMRAAMAQMGRPFRAGEIADALLIIDPRARKYLAGAITDFVRRGEVRRLGDGLLEVVALKEIRAPEIRRRVIRACYVRERFRVADIQRLTDATADYVREIVRDLIRTGLVERIGKNGNVPVYRVVDREHFKLETGV